MLKGQFYKTGQISKKAQYRNSADGRWNFCGWFTDNVQIEEHRRNISFTYRPKLSTNRNAN